MTIDEPIARFLLLMKEMRPGFAVLKIKEHGGTWFYEQPSYSFAIPNLGFQLKKGILLDSDIKRNQEIISEIANHPESSVYFLPVNNGLKVQLYDIDESTKIVDDVIKTISGTGFLVWLQIKICYLRLKLKKNPLYRLFEGL